MEGPIVGVIRRVFPDKGFGFIVPTESPPGTPVPVDVQTAPKSEVFFHSTQCLDPWEDFTPGMAVECVVQQTHKGSRAADVQLRRVHAKGRKNYR